MIRSGLQEADMTDEEFTVSIKGPGVNVEQAVSRELANRAVMLVLSGDGAPPRPPSEAPLRQDILLPEGADPPPSIGELKSKPLQQSVIQLNALGLHPDIIVARAEKTIDKKRREKIALASGLAEEDIVANPDVESIYEVPLILNDQTLGDKVSAKLGLKPRRHDLRDWKNLVQKIKKTRQLVKVGMVGKYQKTGDYTLSDSYVCVVEALKHAGWINGVKPELVWIDSQGLESMNNREVVETFQGLDGVIVPQGWGSRGTEGKLRAIRYVRENKIPYLGLCFGMQMGVIEFSRHVCGLQRANSSEVNSRTPHPVVHIMPRQQEYLKKKQYGGTIRLGQWPCLVHAGTVLEKAYQNSGSKTYDLGFKKNKQRKDRLIVQERHRHRYEVNNRYRRRLESKGMVFSGTSPDGKLVEAMELPPELHPFFVGTQFHPEYQSWPLKPHPIFLEFVKAAMEQL